MKEAVIEPVPGRKVRLTNLGKPFWPTITKGDPVPNATGSAPLTWKELESGASIDDFHLHNMLRRLKKKATSGRT